MIRLLLGGSPCTHWSAAQNAINREITASGIGWDLFENYRIAKEKWKPDFFLYENNKSASKIIKNQIAQDLGVLEEHQVQQNDNQVRFTYINSALFSAQNRHRFYVTNFGNIRKPTDKGVVFDHGLCLRYERTAKGKELRKAYEAGTVKHGFNEFRVLQPRPDGKTNTLTTVLKDNLIAERLSGPRAIHEQRVYEVQNGCITFAGKTYRTRLSDGIYAIRQLSVDEYRELQTVPDWYQFPVPDSRAYKMLANGWTVDVIKHLLAHIPGILDEEIDVLSLYDGMSCGQIALQEMGCNIVRYHAYEIDPYAIKTTQHNFPTTIQMGNAFDVRRPDWYIPEIVTNAWIL